MSYLDSLMASTGLTHRARAAPSAQPLESPQESREASDEVVAQRRPEVPPAATPAAQTVAAFARQPKLDEIDVPSVRITPRPPLARREPEPEAVIQPPAAPPGVSFLEAAAERMEREQTVALFETAATPASSELAPSLAQPASPGVRIEAPPAQVAATFALAREWVAAPAEPREAAPSIEANSVIETAPQSPATADASPSRQQAESEITRFAAMPSEQHVSLSIGAIEVMVEAPSTPLPARTQRPVRPRWTAPSAVEARRAARRLYGRTGGW